MAGRPWVGPEEVKEYSSDGKIKERSDISVRYDIMRAESLIIKYCCNDFEDYEQVPDEVKLAAILLAEKYGHSAARVETGGATSESFDDYSYSGGTGSISIEDMGLEGLLDKYKKAGGGSVVMDLFLL